MLKELLNFSRSKPLFDPTLVIRSGRVVLRGKSHADLANDYSWRADPELTALDGAYPLMLNRAQFASLHKYDVDHLRLDCAKLAIETVDGRHVGNCVFYNIELANERCEYGIMIGSRELWNQGVGTEATQLAAGYIFENTTLKTLYLHTLIDNERALKCFKKCGFEVTEDLVRRGKRFYRMELTSERFAELDVRSEVYN